MGSLFSAIRSVSRVRTVAMAAFVSVLGIAFTPARVYAQDNDRAMVSFSVPKEKLRDLLSEKTPPGRLPGPLQSWAIQLKAGTLGLGADIATTLTSSANLRVGVNLLNAGATYSRAGYDVKGDARFRSASASLDLFPFRGGFHISPGVTYRHATDLYGTVSVAAGSTFYLDGQPYTSSAADPVHGSGNLVAGTGKVVPQLTVGWGNMIPRSGRHLSLPIEFGAQYVGTPTASFALHGTACQQVSYKGQTASVCQPLDGNTTAQADIAAEIQRANNRIAPIRFYPIASVGLAYRF